MDRIDKRNEWEKLKRGIVKYWNVAYSAQQKTVTDPTAEGEEHDAPLSAAPEPQQAQEEQIDNILKEQEFDLDKILKDVEQEDG